MHKVVSLRTGKHVVQMRICSPGGTVEVFDILLKTGFVDTGSTFEIVNGGPGVLLASRTSGHG